jgi:hypothetical protein
MAMRKSRLLGWAVATLVIGCGPLLAILLAARLGLLADPDPNPIGPGLLAAISFWPGMVMVVVGWLRR